MAELKNTDNNLLLLTQRSTLLFVHDAIGHLCTKIRYNHRAAEQGVRRQGIKIAAIHISVPVIFALAVAVIGSQRELGDFLMAIFGGALFYCAPHLCWLGFHLLAKPGYIVLHSGYIGATLALVLIASLWLLPPDQSGLPIQWLAYWPLAAILVILFTGVTYLFPKLRNS